VTARRRKHGEGGIRKRPDGRFEATVDLGLVDGKRTRRYFYAKTEREVIALLQDEQRKQVHGLSTRGGAETVDAYLARWLETWIKPPRKRPQTYDSYETLVRVHLAPGFKGIRLDKLTADHVQAFLNRKAQSGLSPRTVHHLRAVLRAALSRAERSQLVTRNAAKDAEPPRLENHEAEFLLPDQARRFLESVQGDRLAGVCVVTLGLGLRQGEVLGLRWQDIDLEKRRLTVSHALQRIDGELVLVEPKSRSSARTLPLPEVVATALVEQRRLQLEDRVEALKIGRPRPETDLVFTNPLGGPPDGTSVTKGVQRLLARAGLPVITFHELRHSAASLLVAEGVHPRVLQAILGHSSMRLTMEIYSHASTALLEEGAMAMDRALGVQVR
jgi:integrase